VRAGKTRLLNRAMNDREGRHLGGNLGATTLRCHRRSNDPMQAFDALPMPVRRWLTEASLPWSPASCRRILSRAISNGESIDDVLARLYRAERKALTRDQTFDWTTAMRQPTVRKRNRT
jgi:hypothetical protein